MKKLLLSIGTITAFVAPIAGVISCGRKVANRSLDEEDANKIIHDFSLRDSFIPQANFKEHSIIYRNDKANNQLSITLTLGADKQATINSKLVSFKTGEVVFIIGKYSDHEKMTLEIKQNNISLVKLDSTAFKALNKTQISAVDKAIELILHNENKKRDC